jgi:hypothetical protein
MTDRTVKVRLEADISDFVVDIGVKAPAAIDKLEASAARLNKSIGNIGRDSSSLDKLGTKADATGLKLERAGVRAVAAGRLMGSSSSSAAKNADQLASSVEKVDKATAAESKTVRIATKDADAHANAVGRLRVAQLRLAEIQAKPNASASASAGAEESVASAERAVKKFEKAGDDSGKGFGKRFGSSLKKWFTSDGTSVFKQAGQNAGNGFFGALAGVLKTPVLGPIVAAALLLAVTAVAVPAGAVLAGGVVTGFGAGLGALGIVFAAKSEVIKSIWSKTAADLGAQTRQISKPFESTLAAMSVVARRTFAGLKPELAGVFKELGPALTAFGDSLGRAVEKLGPSLQPLAGAFSKVLGSLGPAMNDLFAQLSASLIKLSESISKNPTALADFTRGIGGLVGDLLGFLRIMNDADAAFKRWTGGTSAVTALMYTLRGAVAGVLGPIEGLAKGFSAVGDGMNWLAGKLGVGKQVMDQAGASTTTFSSSLFKVTGALTASAAAGLHNAHATHEANLAATLLAGAYDRQAAATQKAIDALNRESNLLLSLSGSQIGYAQAVADATQAIKDNGRTHDLLTQKGRDNQTALNGVAAAAVAQRDAMIKAGDGNVKAAAAAETGRAAFIKLATQMGYSKAQAIGMADSLIKIPNVTRTAKLQANITDLESKLATAQAKLKNPKLTATQRAKLEADISKLEAGIARAKTALASVPSSKTVTITTNTYKNLVETTTHKDVGVRAPGKATGGPIPGHSPSPTADNIPIMATAGEYMQQKAAVDYYGTGFMDAVNQKQFPKGATAGYAMGGKVGKYGRYATGGSINLAGGQLVDIAYLLQQLGIPFNPTAGINYKSTLTTANRTARAVVPARNTALAADRTEQAAKAQVTAIQRAIQLQQRAVTAARAPKQTTKAGQAAEDRKVAAEQAKLVKLQDQLYAAKTKVTKATKASNAADAVYKIRAEAAAKAATANRDALEKLLAQQQAAVDLAKQVSDSLTGSANIGDLFQQSLTGSGLLADLQSQGADLKEFGKLIAALRAKKLDEDLITQIIGKGAGQGTDLATAILAGGAGLINSLNKAQTNLENQANQIGAGVANQKYNVAGARAGGGDVTAGKTYRVNELGKEYFTAPVDGHISPAGVDPRQYIRSMGGGGNWGSGPSAREVHHHYHTTFNGMDPSNADRIADKVQALAEFRSRSY